jgi:hypothetical protein
MWACHRLDIRDASSIRRVARLVLGGGEAEQDVRPPAAGRSVGTGTAPGTSDAVRRPDDAAPGRAGDAPPAAPRTSIATHLLEVTEPTPLAPASGGALTLGDVGEWQLVPEALFGPLVDRAIGREISALRLPSNRADVEAFLERSAEGRPLERVPMLEALTTRFGVDVLLDGGSHMTAFQRDVSTFPSIVERVLGRGRLRVLWFDTVPARAGTGPRRRWPVYRPVGPRRIVLVTRLDLEGTARAWEPVLRRMERSTARALIVVPHATDRAPPDMLRRLAVVTWDRATTVAAVNRLVWGSP